MFADNFDPHASFYSLVFMLNVLFLWCASVILSKSDNLSRITSGSIDGYMSLSEADYFISDLIVLYPDLITRSVIGKSLEGRDLYVYKLSAVTDSNAYVPKLLITSLIHAREPLSLSASLYILSQLIEEYEAHVTDVEYLLRTRELYVIPIVNPDGYARLSTRTGHRKNARETCPSDPDNSGVDLNRNFGFDWKPVSNKCSEEYSGTGPFSEPETQSIRNFSIAKKFKSAVHFHAYGNILTIPYNGGDQGEHIDENHMRFYTDIKAAWKFKTFGPSRATLNYTTHGESDDWFYDELGVLSMSPELGPESAGFRPKSDQVREVLFDVYPKIKLWMMRAGGPEIDAVRVRLEGADELVIEFENRGLEALNGSKIVVRDGGLCTTCYEMADCHFGMDGYARVFKWTKNIANPLGGHGVLFIKRCPVNIGNTNESMDICVIVESLNCRCFKPSMDGLWASIQVDHISNVLTNTALCELGGMSEYVDTYPLYRSHEQDMFSVVSALLCLVLIVWSLIQISALKYVAR
jgi:hypothetical protein